MRYLPLSTSWFLAALISSCTGSEPAQKELPPTSSLPDREADIRDIGAIYERFSQAYERLDPDRAASLYTEDALYLPPGGDVRRGRSAIHKTFERFFKWAADGGFNLEITFQNVDRDIEGDLAYDVGYYTLTRRSGEEIVSQDRGKFTVIMKRQPDDSWKFHVDAYNSANVETTTIEN